MKKKITKRLLSIVLCVVMVLSCVPMPAMAAEEIATVYFQNNWLWTDVRAYIHYTDGTAKGEFPGEAMVFSHNDNPYDVYSVNFPVSNIDYIVFSGIINDGSGNRDATPQIPASDLYRNAIYSCAFDGGTVYIRTGGEGDALGASGTSTFYAITNGTSEDANGTITVPESAAAGKTVSVTVTPAEGYVLDALTVTDANGDPVTVENNAFTMPAAAVTVSATFQLCAHTGGTATCTQRAVCTICGASYGELDTTNHASENYTYTDNGDGMHTKRHECCGATVTEDHTFDSTGLCVCTAQAQAKLGDTFYLTLQEAAAAVTESNNTIEVLTDVNIGADETLTFAAFATLNVADGKNITCNGAVKIGEEDGILFENTLYYYGGDVTNGRNSSGMLIRCHGISGITYWKAGSGYMIFTPASGGEIAVLELHDAEVTHFLGTVEDGVIDHTDSLTVRFYGDNTISSDEGYDDFNSQSAVFRLDGTATLIGMEPDATLTLISGGRCGIIVNALEVKSGTVSITTRGGSSTSAVSGTSSVTVDSGAVLNLTLGEVEGGCGVGAVVAGDTVHGTLNGLIVVPADKALGISFATSGDAVLIANFTVPAEEPIPFTVPAGTSLTVNSGVTLDLSLLALEDIAFDGTVINNGTILLPEGFDINDAPKSGAVSIGDKSYTWSGSQWNCSADSHSFDESTHICAICGAVETYKVYWAYGQSLGLTESTAALDRDFVQTIAVPENTHLRIADVYLVDDPSVSVSYTYANGVLTILAADLPAADIEVQCDHYVEVKFHSNGGVIQPEDGFPLAGDTGFAADGSYWIQEFSVDSEIDGLRNGYASRDGYTFQQWQDASGKVYPMDTGDYVLAAEDVTLYAQWAVNSYTYRVETYTMSAYGYYGEPVTEEKSAPYGTQVNAAPNALEEGFYLDTEHADSLLTATVPANDDLVLKVYIGRSQYPITWDLNGGGTYFNDLPNSKYYGVSQLTVYDSFVKEGYTFSHLEDASGNQYVDGSPNSDCRRFYDVDMPVGGLTLKAIWTVNAYTLHVQDQTMDVDYGTALDAALGGITPEKTGYTHTSEWTYYSLDEDDVEQPYTGTTMPAVELYAEPVFEPIQYNITWDMTGCSYYVTNYHGLPQQLTYNADTYQHNVNFLEITPPEGYEFVGFVDGNGKEMEYTVSDHYRLYLTVSGDMTVKAVIQPKTYRATWESGDGDGYEKTFKYGETITIPTSEFFKETFRKAGYTLTGWEGYTEGMTMPIGGVTFTAKWQINEAALSASSGIYNGQPHTPTVTVEGLTEGEGFTVNYPADMTNAGEKTITVTGALDSTTVTYTIEKAPTPQITFPTVTKSVLTYGDRLQEAELSFYANDDGTFDWAAPTAVPNAGIGDYALDFYPNAAALRNYEWTDTDQSQWIESRNALCAMGRVDVAKAKAEITVDTTMNVTYGQTVTLPTATSNFGTVSCDKTAADLVNAGTYTLTYTVAGTDNYDGDTKAVIVVVSPKTITVTAEDKNKTYGEADPVLTYKVEGLVNGDELTGELKRVAGENVGSYAIGQNTVAAGDNYTINYVEAELTIHKRNVSITPKDQTITYGGAISNTEIVYDGLMDGHSATATLTPSTANVTADGTITASAAVITAGSTDVTANYEISYGAPAKLVIEPDTSKIVGLTTENITSANAADVKAVQEMMENADSVKDAWNEIITTCEDLMERIEEVETAKKEATEKAATFDADTVKTSDKAKLNQLIEEIEALLDTKNLTEAERKALTDAKTEAEALIAIIDAVADATDTENTGKVENVTAENVTPEDKTDLQKAKADLEKVLEENDGNYTEDEKKIIRKELERIKAAITALEKVENVTETVTELPEAVEPDDEAAAEKILKAKEAYDALTDHEKSLVEETVKKKLKDLVAALSAYDIIKGDGSAWTQDSDGSISFTANGAFSKFVGIKVDGKAVDKANYEAKSGSTIITLKASYLDTLKVGEHTITVVYTDGSTDGTFKILAKANTPATGDDFNSALYGFAMAISMTALFVLLMAAKKRKQAQ